MTVILNPNKDAAERVKTIKKCACSLLISPIKLYLDVVVPIKARDQ